MEACIDVANHIIVANEFRRAEEYADIFQVLKENNILSGGLGDSLSSMARMRNILVHRYADVDKNRLITVMKEKLGDIEEFMRAVSRYLAEKESPKKGRSTKSGKK